MSSPNYDSIIDQTKSINKEYHYLLEIADSPKNSLPKGRLEGYAISIKDCICVKEMESKAGSLILENYVPQFDATVVSNIKKEGGFILGKTTQDVFGFGSFNINSSYPIPLHPLDKNRVCGGSSGGAAGLTKKVDFPHIAIAESTGGSIAAPAAFCGVYGLTPTYGRVSRYGLIDYANSLDKIGVMANNIQDIALMMEIIAGYDSHDATSSKDKVPTYTKQKKSSFTLALIKESLDVDNQIVALFDSITANKVSMPLTFAHGVSTYYMISMAEASTNLAKLCGLRYGKQLPIKGHFNDYFTTVRSQYFEDEVKRRIMLGTFVRMAGYRDAYYLKAMQVRTNIIQEYKELFKQFDILLSPTMPITAPTQKEIAALTPWQHYMMDIMTVGPNLAGLPHLSIPLGEVQGLPVGVLAIADHFEEQKLLDFGRIFHASHSKFLKNNIQIARKQ